MSAEVRPRRGAVLMGLALLSVSLGGCVYSFQGGSFPDHIDTLAVQLFENDTDRFEITNELFEAMRRNLPSALGIRTAGEDVADAVVRGTITRYEVTAPNYRAAAGGERAEVLQREVTVTVEVEIVDLTRNEVLWEERGLRSQGLFLEAGGREEEGRAEAIELLVQKIVDGAQSNW